MSGLGALALTLGLAAAKPGGGGPLWLTLDVDNPEVISGHRLLSLADILGVNRRTDVPGLPAVRALVAFGVRAEDCGSVGLCTRVKEATEDARARGLLVVAVVLGTKEQVAASRPEVRAAHHPFVVTYDVHGLLRDTFGFDAPGTFVVMDDKGMNIGRTRPSKEVGNVGVGQMLEMVAVALGPDEGDKR